MQEKNLRKKQISHFSRWTRKSYAVFNSLNKIVKISGLSVAITAVALPGELVAQQDTAQQVSGKYNLEEVEITDEAAFTALLVPSQLIAVITADELRSSPVRSVQDVLNAISQIDLRQRGNNDIQADISIRGGTFDQVLVMLNGVNITNPQTGHHNLDIPISLDQIERVEILNGAGSQSFGANAYSGVVNIITKNSYKNSIELKAIAGDFALFDLGAAANISGKKQRHFIAVDHSQSSGYTTNTDFLKTNLFYNGRKNLRSSFFEWQLAGGQKAFGAQDFYTAKYPNQFEETQSALASLGYQSFGNKLKTKTHIYWSMHSDRFELFRDNEDAPAWYRHHNYHLTNVAGGNSRYLLHSLLGWTTLGADVRYEHIASNVLGQSTGDTIKAWFNPEGFYTKAASRTNFSFFAEHSASVNKLDILLSLMLNTNTAYAGKWNLYPGIDLNYSLGDYSSLKASFNKSLRLPTFTDLYYAGPANIGNADLKPEEALNLDLGFSFAKSIFEASITSFNSWGQNSIDWVRLSDTVKWQPMNVTKTETYGIDSRLALDFSGKSPFLRRISLQYTFIHKSSSSGEYQSRYVMDYLRHKVVFTLSHRIFRDIGMVWQWRFQQRNGNYLKWDAENGQDVSVPYGSYNLLDIRLYWQHKAWFAFVDIKNVFDIEYYDYGNVAQAGRWFSLGLKLKFQ